MARRKFKVEPKLKALMGGYYFNAKLAEGKLDKKICWITSGGPVELLLTFDIIPIYPENHGAMCGVTKMASALAQVAEARGYSRDLCSYARADIGSAITGNSPIGGLPKPDLLLCVNNICSTVVKWYEVLARFFNVPLFLIDTPFVHDKIRPHDILYIKKQMEEFIDALERICGRKFDEEKFKNIIARSIASIRLWKEILSLSANIPAPISSFDAFIQMAPIVTLRGTEEVVAYYQELKADLVERVEQGIGAVEGEKYRLLWDNLPIWYAMRSFSELLAMHNACLVADTYTNAWAFDAFDVNAGLDGYAEAYGSVFLNLGLIPKFNQIKELIHRFKVQGVIMHSNRSCKPYSLGQYDLRDMIIKETGKPVLILEADMCDDRIYSDASIRNRVEAFMEMIKS